MDGSSPSFRCDPAPSCAVKVPSIGTDIHGANFAGELWNVQSTKSMRVIANASKCAFEIKEIAGSFDGRFASRANPRCCNPSHMVWPETDQAVPVKLDFSETRQGDKKAMNLQGFSRKT